MDWATVSLALVKRLVDEDSYQSVFNQVGSFLWDRHPDEHHEVNACNAQHNADFCQDGPCLLALNQNSRPDQEQAENEGCVEEVPVTKYPGERLRQTKS